MDAPSARMQLPSLVPTLALATAQPSPALPTRTVATAVPVAPPTTVAPAITMAPAITVAPAITMAPPTTVAPPLSHVDLVKGPDVLYTGKPTEMKLFWQGRAGQAFRVDWGTDAQYGAGSQPVSAYDAENHLYAITLAGLQPDTRYLYRVVVNNQAAEGSFRSAPLSSALLSSAPLSGASDLKFVAYGDTRTHPEIHEAVAAGVLGLVKADPAYQTLELLTGDLVSDGSSQAAWDSEFFDPGLRNIRAELATLAVLPVIGNHEAGSPLFSRYFPLPYVDAHYWSFDYGPAHFVMLDQYSEFGAGSAQYNWLKADLAATRQPWKIVTLHEPGWSAGGGHPNNATVQDDLQPLFEQYGVALVLGGHLHYYARAEVRGVTHLTLGTGGAPLYPAEPNMPDIVTTYLGAGYARFAIHGATLDAWFVDTSGQVRDRFTLLAKQ
ncbi:MAG TPA: metallophosphoesterase [Anaerolineaceae bacterium]